MGEYLAKRIEQGFLDYGTIIKSKRYSKYKETIDAKLKQDGCEEMIV